MSARPRKTRETAEKPANETAEKSTTPRIIGIGASAGGLEPFEQFFSAIPEGTGCAFVVVQHLSPDFKSMMDELLHRQSPLKIRRVEEGMTVEPDTIFLNPPRAEMEIKDGKFVLNAVPKQQALHLPINTLFKSIAREQGKASVGIVLSGTGSDGTLGAETIRAAGGKVLVQELSTAKFDGMPASVLDRMDVDGVGSPNVLAQMVCKLARGQSIALSTNGQTVDPKHRAFEILRDRYATDFNYYKPTTIERRLVRRAELIGLSTIDDYVRRLETDEEEIEALYSDLLIEVTEFFRDVEAFKALEKSVLHELAEKVQAREQIRVWVPGCASGQEAYSIAILLSEQARALGVDLELKILATDIHHRSLESANIGLYDEGSVKEIPQDLLDRYFEKIGERYQIRPAIRQMVVFSVHNILRDPPFTRIDLISCRNLLIYLKDDAQQKALAYFHFSLNTGGYLMLGPSEAVGAMASEFDPVDSRWRIYRKRRDVRLIESMTQLPRQNRIGGAPPKQLAPFAKSGSVSLVSGDARRVHDRALNALLKRYAPAGFMLRRSGEVVRIFGDAGRFVEVGEGNFSQRIDDLIRTDLRVVVAAAMDRTKSPQVLPFQRRVRTPSEQSTHTSLTVTLDRLSDAPNDDDFLLLTIEEEKREIVTPPDVVQQGIEDIETVTLLRQGIQDLERELQSSEETLQTTIEELETSNEELQATNEELMASNEELQSTNEELHSVNEELFTVSAEHQRKIVELTEVSNDIEHLLKATDVGTIFIDAELKVRRFTPAANRAFNVITQDIGRPISHLTNRLTSVDVPKLAQEVIASRAAIERDVRIEDGHILLRILPYISSDRVTNGAVITTIDVTELKRAQDEQRKIATHFEAVVEDIDDFIIRWRKDTGLISFCNDASLEFCGKSRDDILGAAMDTIIPEKARSEFNTTVNALKCDESANLLVDFRGTAEAASWSSLKLRAVGDCQNHEAITEYQLIGRDVSVETEYRSALEKLSITYSNFEGSVPELLEDLLSIGAEFFGAELGVFTYVDKAADRCRIVAAHNGKSFDITSDEPAVLSEWFSSFVVKNNGLFCVDHASQDEVCSKLPMHKNTGIEAFIGDLVSLRDGRIAVASFASRKPRRAPLDKLQQDFMQLFADRVGKIVDIYNANQALERQREELRFVVDNIPADIWYSDDANRVLWVNENAARSTGVSVEKASGTEIDQLFSADMAAYHADDLNALNSATPLQNVVQIKKSKAEQKSWVDLGKVRRTDPVTGQQRLLSVGFDITAVKDREETVRELNQQLSRNNTRLMDVNAGLRQFAHVASHDLQEPLRKLVQFTEYLQEDCASQLTGDGPYFLDVIADSAQRMRVLVRDILALSSASGKELSLKDCSVSSTIKTLWNEFDLVVEETGATLKLGHLPHVSADPALFEHLMRNLIGNALKYRQEGVAPHIEISSRKLDGSGTTLLIADNGIGIDIEQPERVFEPFVRLHDRNSYAGTGIGLAICRTVCDRHGWFIKLDETSNSGSIFRIDIPK